MQKCGEKKKKKIERKGKKKEKKNRIKKVTRDKHEVNRARFIDAATSMRNWEIGTGTNDDELSPSISLFTEPCRCISCSIRAVYERAKRD